MTQTGGKGRWSGSARRFLEEPAAAATVDHATNARSVAGGATGFVRKVSRSQDIPRAGLLIGPEVLVWCALFEARG